MSALQYDNNNPSPTMKHLMLGSGVGGIKQSPTSLDLSACARFFGISELLELTLRHIPPLQLFIIQRVNTTFRDIISASGPLQQKLFLKADPSKGNGCDVDWNPFIRKLETEWEHDYLQQTFWNGCGKLRMRDLTNVYPNASWKKMLVCQPPRSKVQMMRFCLTSSRHLGILAIVEAGDNGEVCRMSHVYEHGWQNDHTMSDDCYVKVDR